MKRLLVVEDEKPIARFLQLELEHEGFEVTWAADGETGLTFALERDFDLILLDLMLPGLNGSELCRRLRQCKTTPVIMLTARSSVSDRVKGLDCGADDYVVKPFAIEELMARIRSIERRIGANLASSAVHSLEDLVLDDEAHRVTRGEALIELSTREYELLRYMLTHKGIVLSRDKLLHEVWGYPFAGETNVVDVYIRYLRVKVDDPFHRKLIQTVRGFGYVLRGSE